MRSPIQISPEVGSSEAGDHAHGGGLAAAGRAEEDQKFLVVDVEGLVVDADDVPPALGDVLEC